MLLKCLVVGPIAANCYIIGNGSTHEGAIIDPGDEAERISLEVRNQGLHIKYLIGTHGHFDHTAAVAPLKKLFKCDFLLHIKDVPFVQHSKKSALEWGIAIEQVPEPDKFIDHGDVLKLGNLELRILHTPGHSPGGISIHIESENLVLTGDTLFQGSIGRTDFMFGSMDELILSIREKLYTLPDKTVAYTGHGDPTTIGNEKKYNCFVRG